MAEGIVGWPTRGHRWFRDTDPSRRPPVGSSSYLFNLCCTSVVCEHAAPNATSLKEPKDLALEPDFSLTACAGTRQGRDMRLAFQPLHGLVSPCPPEVRASDGMLRTTRQQKIARRRTRQVRLLWYYVMRNKNSKKQNGGRSPFSSLLRLRRGIARFCRRVSRARCVSAVLGLTRLNNIRPCERQSR